MTDQKKIINDILEALPKAPRTYDTSDDPGFWSDGKQILCPSITDCTILADFFKDLLANTNITILTGYYDHFEDARNGECDDYTGFNYICFE